MVSCKKWYSHSLRLIDVPAGSCVEKAWRETSSWCQQFIVLTYPADRKWQFAQACEWRHCICYWDTDWHTLPKTFPEVCIYQGKARWLCMLFSTDILEAGQYNSSWGLTAVWYKSFTHSPFLPRCLQPVSRISTRNFKTLKTPLLLLHSHVKLVDLFTCGFITCELHTGA